MSSISKAIKELENRDFDGAKDIFNEIASDKKLASAAHAGLAICYAQENNINSAKNELNISEKSGETNLLSCIASGYILDRKDKITEAESYFIQATKIDPNSSYAHLTLGSFLLFRERNEQAIKALSQAKKLGGNRWVVSRNLSIAYIRIGKQFHALRESIVAFVSKPSLESLKLITASAFRYIKIGLILIFGIGIYFFLRSPLTFQGISILAATLILVELTNRVINQEKIRPRNILFILVLALSYYLIYVK